MADQSVTFTVERGQDFSRTCTMRDSSGALINLTGYTVTAKIKRTTSDDYSVADFTCTILNQVSSTGQFTLVLTDTKTSAIPVDPATDWRRGYKNYVFDVVLTDPSGIKDRIIQGVIKLVPGAT